jgi:hypothetical protein
MRTYFPGGLSEDDEVALVKIGSLSRDHLRPPRHDSPRPQPSPLVLDFGDRGEPAHGRSFDSERISDFLQGKAATTAPAPQESLLS